MDKIIFKVLGLLAIIISIIMIIMFIINGIPIIATKGWLMYYNFWWYWGAALFVGSSGVVILKLIKHLN